MLIEVLSKAHIDIPTYSCQFVEILVCGPSTKSCWNSMYDECKEGMLINFILHGDLSIKWFHWEKQLTVSNKRRL